MLVRYEKFLEITDARLEGYFKKHKEYICCSKGCAACCEIGEYPFSRLEAEYLMKGFLTLPVETQRIIKQNIKRLLIERQNFSGERFLYSCPCLINKECALYKYRGLVCRTYGLAYVSGGRVYLPECVNSQLNYSAIYNSVKGEVIFDEPIKEDLHIDKLLKSPLARLLDLECGVIRPLIEWFSGE